MLWSPCRILTAFSAILPLCVAAVPAGDLPLMPWPQKVELAADGASLKLVTPLDMQVKGDDLHEALPRCKSISQTGSPLFPSLTAMKAIVWWSAVTACVWTVPRVLAPCAVWKRCCSWFRMGRCRW